MYMKFGMVAGVVIMAS